MREFLKFGVLAVASAIVAFPVSGVAGLIGVVVALVALAKVFGSPGRPPGSHGPRQ